MSHMRLKGRTRPKARPGRLLKDRTYQRVLDDERMARAVRHNETAMREARRRTERSAVPPAAASEVVESNGPAAAPAESNASSGAPGGAERVGESNASSGAPGEPNA